MRLAFPTALLLASCAPLYPRLSAPTTSAAPAPVQTADAVDSSTHNNVLSNSIEAAPTQIGFIQIGLNSAMVAPSTCIALLVFGPSTEPTEGASPVAEPVNVVTSSSTGTFYSDASCQQELGREPFVPAANNGGTAVSYQDTATSGLITLSVTDAGTLGLASGSLSFTVDAPTRILLEDDFAANATDNTVPWSLAAGSCWQIDLTPVDQAGTHMITGDNININLSMSGAAGKFFSNATCTQPISVVTIPKGPGNNWSFFIQGVGAGPATLTATPAAPSALPVATAQITFTKP